MQKIFNITQDVKHYKIYILGIKIRLSKKGYKKFVPPATIAGHPILRMQAGNDCIFETLMENKPCFMTRFGGTESIVLKYYEENYKKNRPAPPPERCTTTGLQPDGLIDIPYSEIHFPDYIKEKIYYLSGFFTPDDKNLSRFVYETLNMIKNIDVLGVEHCFSKNGISEELWVSQYASSNIKIVGLHDFSDDAVRVENPWTRYLKGKKVLVIHPFEKSIISQYKKHEKLFKNPLTLPDFYLETIKAVQGLEQGEAKSRFKDWFEALEYMYGEIDKKDFDIALIGAGAFGMFLANYIKQKGKQAIHAGGGLQILFGIKGTRWNKGWADIYNEHWASALPEECPSDLTNFLKGEKSRAYW